MKFRQTITIAIDCAEEEVSELLKTYKQKGYDLLSVKEDIFTKNEEEQFTISMIRRLEAK